MPTIIRDLPYFEKETSVTVRGREYPVLSYQIVLWVSVSHKGLDTLDASTPRFPAVLDTGFTHNFLIQPDQLKSWAGLMPEHLKQLGQFRAYGELVPLHAGSVWLIRTLRASETSFPVRRRCASNSTWASVSVRVECNGRRACRCWDSGASTVPISKC